MMWSNVTWTPSRALCRQSQSTSRGAHRNPFLEVQSEIRAHRQYVKKTLLTEATVVGWGTFRHYCGSPRSEVIIKNGLPPVLVDDALFRKVLIPNFSHGPSSRVHG